MPTFNETVEFTILSEFVYILILKISAKIIVAKRNFKMEEYF